MESRGLHAVEREAESRGRLCMVKRGGARLLTKVPRVPSIGTRLRQ